MAAEDMAAAPSPMAERLRMVAHLADTTDKIIVNQLAGFSRQLYFRLTLV